MRMRGPSAAPASGAAGARVERAESGFFEAAPSSRRCRRVSKRVRSSRRPPPSTPQLEHDAEEGRRRRGNRASRSRGRGVFGERRVEDARDFRVGVCSQVVIFEPPFFSVPLEPRRQCAHAAEREEHVVRGGAMADLRGRLAHRQKRLLVADDGARASRRNGRRCIWSRRGSTLVDAVLKAAGRGRAVPQVLCPSRPSPRGGARPRRSPGCPGSRR